MPLSGTKPIKDFAEKKYSKKLRSKKRLLRLIMLAGLIVSVIMTVDALMNRFGENTKPQISRAIVQVSKLLPQLESNENAVREVYEQMLKSRQAILGDDAAMLSGDIDELLSGSLSWMERITKIKVGRDGYVFVVSKKDGTVIAHPDSGKVGRRVTAGGEAKEFVDSDDTQNADKFADISVESIDPDVSPEELDISCRIIIPYGEDGMLNPEDINDITIGSVASYKDTYIICGIGFLEMFGYMAGGLALVLVPLVLIWVFVRYVCFHFDSRRESAKALRPKLFAYSVILSALVLGMSWYMQELTEMTEDLKTMEKHAHVAVDTLNTYAEIRGSLNEWLDEQYLIQCKIAASFMSLVDRDILTREDIGELAELLDVKYVYLFDKNGKVVVTNSPYDHLELSTDKESQSYAFRPLLDGADHVIQEPLKNDVFGDYMQYIGVSLRDGNDLCDGFVQIGVDPSLRDRLIEPLNVDTVLSNLIIGLPKHAVAIDKETLSIAATTGIGHKGQLMEELGITSDELTANFSGFLWIDGTEYYAGFSESSDLYLVPIVPRIRTASAFLTSLKLAGISFVTLILIIFAALHRYDSSVVAAAEALVPENDAESGKETNDKLDADDEIDEEYGLFSGFSKLIKVQDKKFFDERWNVNSSKDERSPEVRIRKVIYRVLLVFCVLNLIPVIWFGIFGNNDTDKLTGLAYVIMGRWEKGLNIFAVSSCVFLLFVLYVLIVLANRILYHIARISDMRVETICLLLRSSLKYICAIVFIYFGLSQFGIATQTLLASAGILSLVIGLGAKDLVNDVIAGFFIIFEGTFKVGDFVYIGNFYGTVTQIGIRTTRVTFFSETKIFNNSSIRDIINSNGNVSRTVLLIPVSYKQDLLALEEVFAKELPPLFKTIPGLVKPPRYQGIQEMNDTGVAVRIALFSVPYMRGRAQRAMMRELKLILERYGIETPYRSVIIHQAPETGFMTGDETSDEKTE